MTKKIYLLILFAPFFLSANVFALKKPDTDFGNIFSQRSDKENKDDSNTDKYGRPQESLPRDTNAGTYHVIPTNSDGSKETYYYTPDGRVDEHHAYGKDKKELIPDDPEPRSTAPARSIREDLPDGRVGPNGEWLPKGESPIGAGDDSNFGLEVDPKGFINTPPSGGVLLRARPQGIPEGLMLSPKQPYAQIPGSNLDMGDPDFDTDQAMSGSANGFPGINLPSWNPGDLGSHNGGDSGGTTTGSGDPAQNIITSRNDESNSASSNLTPEIGGGGGGLSLEATGLAYGLAHDELFVPFETTHVEDLVVGHNYGYELESHVGDNSVHKWFHIDGAGHTDVA